MHKIQLEKSDCYFLVSVDGNNFGYIASTKDGWQFVSKREIKEIHFEIAIAIDEIVELLNSPARMGY